MKIRILQMFGTKCDIEREMEKHMANKKLCMDCQIWAIGCCFGDGFNNVSNRCNDWVEVKNVLSSEEELEVLESGVECDAYIKGEK